MSENRSNRTGAVAGIAAVGGAAVLATVGAPQSLEYVLRVGLDSPGQTGHQIAAAVCGSLGIAVALLLVKWWRALMPLGAVGVFAASVAHLPAAGELALRLTGDDLSPPPADIGVHPVAACVLAAASGVLLGGLLGAAQHLVATTRAGTAITAIIACAAYYGVAVVGLLSESAGAVRLSVVAGLAVVSTAALLDRSEDAPADAAKWPAAVVVLLPVVPTVFVAAMGTTILGTAPGWVTGLLLTALALIAAGGVRTVLAVAASGLLLAAPVTLLIFLHSSPAEGRPWYSWPLALLGVLLGAGVTLVRRRVTAAAVLAFLAAVPMVLLGAQVAGEDRTSAQVLAWAFVVLTLAAIAAAVGAVAPGEQGRFPAYAALSLTAGVGLTAVIGLLSPSSDEAVASGHVSGLDSLVGPHSLYVSAGYAVVAGILLVILSRLPAAQEEETEEEPLEEEEAVRS